MLEGRSSFPYRATLLGGTVLCAITLTGAGAQAANLAAPARPVAGVSAGVEQIADEGAAGGPAGFADLAEKVQPAVIGVVVKLAADRKTLHRQALGAPDDEDEAPDQEIPMPGLRGPDHGEGPTAKPHEAVTIGSGFFISADG